MVLIICCMLYVMTTGHHDICTCTHTTYATWYIKCIIGSIQSLDWTGDIETKVPGSAILFFFIFLFCVYVCVCVRVCVVYHCQTEKFPYLLLSHLQYNIIVLAHQ